MDTCPTDRKMDRQRPDKYVGKNGWTDNRQTDKRTFSQRTDGRRWGRDGQSDKSWTNGQTKGQKSRQIIHIVQQCRQTDRQTKDGPMDKQRDRKVDNYSGLGFALRFSEPIARFCEEMRE